MSVRTLNYTLRTPVCIVERQFILSICFQLNLHELLDDACAHWGLTNILLIKPRLQMSGLKMWKSFMFREKCFTLNI